MVYLPLSLQGHFCFNVEPFCPANFRNRFFANTFVPLQVTNPLSIIIMKLPKLFGKQSRESVASNAIEIPTSQVKIEERALGTPDKVYFEQQKDGIDKYEYSFLPPATLDRFWDALNGFYGTQNLIHLFYCLPEVFAPIHEIASRVADACWQLRKERTDEIDDQNKTFQRLFSQPNPLYAFRQFVYNSVCYEILTGRTFWSLNKPDTLPDIPESILSWFVLRAHKVTAIQKLTDFYSMTEINDLVERYEEATNTGTRRFEPKNIIPIVNFSLETGYDINNATPLIKGAEKAIANLLPVYEARGIIYIKRGALGFIVNRAKDASGTIAMTDMEKKEIAELHTDQYGVTGNKSPYAWTSANVDFLRTAMSIQELQPFDETLADAVAIYRTLRVPRHLVPSKDNSTFSNAESDMKSFYIDVIIPWAKRYAQAWTNGIGFKAQRRYIFPDYSHIEILNDNKKDKATTDNQNTQTAILQYNNNIITKNQMLGMLGQDAIPGGDVYAKDTSNPDPLAVKLGVGGVQAMQAVLADSALSEEAKQNILVIVFGVSQKDAKKMVIEKVIEPPVNPLNDGGKNTTSPEGEGAQAKK